MMRRKKMATKAQICNFIKLIAPDVQKAYKALGKVKPSVLEWPAWKAAPELPNS